MQIVAKAEREMEGKSQHPPCFVCKNFIKQMVLGDRLKYLQVCFQCGKEWMGGINSFNSPNIILISSYTVNSVFVFRVSEIPCE